MRTTELQAQMPALERLEPVHTIAMQRIVAALRVLLGFTFLWAFVDKMFALGFSTGRVLDDAGNTVKIAFFGDAAWFHGASPTVGAIGFALKGPFADTIQTVTGFQMTQTGPTVNAWVDWVYMVSMLLIGVGLITGVMTRLSAIGGIIWLAVFYLATAVWPEHNPVVDEHVIDAVVLLALIYTNAGRYYGLGKIWQRLDLVKDRRYLY